MLWFEGDKLHRLWCTAPQRALKDKFQSPRYYKGFATWLWVQSHLLTPEVSHNLSAHFAKCAVIIEHVFGIISWQIKCVWKFNIVCSQSLRWRHNGPDCVSNHQPHDCLFNRLFQHRSKKTSKLRVTGLCAGKSPGTDEFPAQRASYAENVSIWWRHHACVFWCPGKI